MSLKIWGIICLILTGCNRPLTIQEQELLTLVGVISAGCIIYNELEKNNSTVGEYYPQSHTSAPVPVCFKGRYQGCCSYHGGLLGCLNFKVICQDGTESPTCRCPSSYCVFPKSE